MDDTRTQQMLDDLADVFLTGPMRRAPAPQESQPAEPGPIRLGPKVSRGETAPQEPPPTAAPGPTLRLANDEALSDPAEPPPASAQRRAVVVQAVFLGNLPGFAGAWLGQYAQHLAEQHHGGVAIVHMEAPELEVEFVGGRGPAPARDGTVVEALDRWARAEELAAVLVHLNQPVAPEGLAIARDLEAWTILCGADDAATVNAYCLLKQLLAGDPQPAQRRVAVMVMGHSEAEARQMAENLNITAASHLGSPVQLAGWRKQIAPVQLQGSWRFAAESNPWSMLNAYLRALPRGRAKMPAAAALEQGTPTAPKPASAAIPRRSVGRAAPPPRERETARPKEEVGAEVAADLARYVAGSIKLEARCPDHPDTQLLLDEQGRIHLARHVGGLETDGPQAAQRLRSVVLDLLEARRWVRRHRQLLALTQRQCRFDEQASPVLHLFTAQGKQAGAILRRLGKAVKIHLLQSVRVGGETAWTCSELN